MTSTSLASSVQRRVPLVAIFTAAGASDEILAGFIAKLRGDENPPMDDDDPMAELVVLQPGRKGGAILGVCLSALATGPSP